MSQSNTVFLLVSLNEANEAKTRGFTRREEHETQILGLSGAFEFTSKNGYLIDSPSTT